MRTSRTTAGHLDECELSIGDIIESVTKTDPKIEFSATADGMVDMTFFFQLYADRDRKNSEILLKEVEELGCKGIFVTVDAVTNEKESWTRECLLSRQWLRLLQELPGSLLPSTKKVADSQLMSGFIDPALVWDDIKWLRKSTKVPLMLKGIMTWQDAVLTAQHGVDGIILSNHGGRNLDTCPPSILTLLEIQRNASWVFQKLEIIVDGGIKRGTDIFKALCLGASSVEIGRGFLYSVNYGEDGVEEFIGILRDELETTRRSMCANSLKELHPGMVSTRDVDHLASVGEKHPWATGIAKARVDLEKEINRITNANR